MEASPALLLGNPITNQLCQQPMHQAAAQQQQFLKALADQMRLLSRFSRRKRLRRLLHLARRLKPRRRSTLRGRYHQQASPLPRHGPQAKRVGLGISCDCIVSGLSMLCETHCIDHQLATQSKAHVSSLQVCAGYGSPAHTIHVATQGNHRCPCPAGICSAKPCVRQLQTEERGQGPACQATASA